MFKILESGEWEEAGFEEVFVNPARSIWEKNRAKRDAFLKVITRLREPRAICETLCRTTEKITTLPVGSIVCQVCQEVWLVEKIVEACEHKINGFCVLIAPQYRSEPAQRFYEWCKENGF